MLTVTAATEALYDALVAEYADEAALVPLVMAGDSVVLDWCGSEGCPGMLFVRVVTMFPCTRLPTPSVDPMPCKGWAATFHVGIGRCVSAVAEDGEAPEATVQTSESLALVADVPRLLRAACTALRGEDHVVGSWLPFGPAGGCAGGVWPVTARVRP